MMTAEGGEVGMELIAAKLLKENLILTALELHTELMENGLQIKCLQDYFSNPVNFENVMSSSPATRNAAGSSTYYEGQDSDTFHGSDLTDTAVDNVDRLGVCEFELRLANDTIRSLRAQLTSASGEDDAQASTVTNTATGEASNTHGSAPLRQHEQRVINYLVHEYLLQNDYRLSSVTFCEEVTSQDVQDWDDVGLNTARPPELVNIFRRFAHGQDDYVQTNDVCCMTDDVVDVGEEGEEDGSTIGDDDELADLRVDPQELINRLNGENNDLMQDNQTLTSKCDKLTSQVNGLQEQLSYRPPPHAIAVDKPTTPSRLSMAPKYHSDKAHETMGAERHVPPRFLAYLQSEPSTSEDDSLITMHDQLSLDFSSPSNLLLLLKSSLPRILPNVLLNKRHEVIALLVAASCTSREGEEEEDDLLTHLFSLVAKPTELQRSYIASGCAAFARQSKSGADVEARLLPLCWEQMSHKHSERRALVADTCRMVAPEIPHHLVSSLILSMIIQMIGDEMHKSTEVRMSLIQTLAVCLSLIEDESKIPLVRPIVFNAATDDHQRVRGMALQYLLPSFCEWTMETNKFGDFVVDHVMQAAVEYAKEDKTKTVFLKHVQLLTELSTMVYVVLLRQFGAEGEKNIVENGDHAEEPDVEVDTNDVLTHMIDPSELSKLTVCYRNRVKLDWWPRTDLDEYLHGKFATSLIEMCSTVVIEDGKGVEAIVDMLVQWSSVLGQVYVRKTFATKFETALGEMTATSAVGCAIIPAYLVGVLKGQPTDDLLVTSLLTNTEDAAAEKCLLTTTELYFTQSTMIPLAGQDRLIELVCGMVANEQSTVRQRLAKVIQTMVDRGASPVQCRTRLLPALITLANDASSAEVRAASVASLFTLVEAQASDERMLEKVSVSLATLFADESLTVRQCLLKQVASRAPTIPPAIRERAILPELTQIAKTEEINADLRIPLFDALCALSCSKLSQESIKNHLAPSLRNLIPQLESQHGRVAQSILKDVEGKLTVHDHNATVHTSPFSAAKLTPSINYAALKTSLRQKAANISTNLYGHTTTPSDQSGNTQ